MQKLLNSVGRVVNALSIMLVVAVLVVLLVGVFYRYVLQRPLFWSDQLSINLFTWLLFFGTVVSVRTNNMFRIELLSCHFPERWKTPHRAFVSLCCICVYVLLTYYGWFLAMEQTKAQLYAFPELFPTVNFAWVYVAVPISFGLMTVYELNNLLLTLAGEKERQS